MMQSPVVNSQSGVQTNLLLEAKNVSVDDIAGSGVACPFDDGSSTLVRLEPGECHQEQWT